LGFALTQPAAVTLAVFAALGLGLALPFLAVSLVPAVGRRLPRPGPWMTRLKQGLAFPMYASAAWLVWVLAQQAGPDAVLAVLAGATLLAFGLWLAVPVGAAAGRVARGAGAVAGVAGLALLAVPAGVGGAGAVAREAPRLGEPYSAARLEAALADGGPVFVEMTAAWCITCQVNERVALSGARFAETLAATGTTYLVGDWTNEDPAITAFIERFRHPGVPLYVLWPAGGGAPEVLPQVLTPGLVATALERAAAPAG
jgi:thiol:disulfide interchange protein DsbD